jgi:FtsH-binding integral membrane protein
MSAIFFQSLVAIFLTRSLYPIKFPNIPLKIVQGFIILLTLIAEILYYRSEKFPFLESNGFVNWNTDPLSGGIRGLIVFSFLIPALIIFIDQTKSKDRKVRRKATLFVVLLGIVLISLPPFFIVFKGMGIAEIIMLIFIVFFLGALAFWTKKTEEPKFVKKL